MKGKTSTAPATDGDTDAENEDTENQGTAPEDREPQEREPHEKAKAGSSEDEAEDQKPENKEPTDQEPTDQEAEGKEPEDKEAEDQKPADQEPESGTKPKPLRPRSVTRLALQIGPAVALLVVSVLLTMLWRENADLSEDARQRRNLTTSAGKVASTFFNWDYRHMKQSFAAKYPLLTKKAAGAIRPTAGALTSYFTTNQVGSQANINGVYPGDIKGGEAHVLVILNTKVTTAKSVQSNTGATVSINLKRVSGKWLADNITLLSSGTQSITDKNGKPLENGAGPSLPNGVPSARPTP